MRYYDWKLLKFKYKQKLFFKYLLKSILLSFLNNNSELFFKLKMLLLYNFNFFFKISRTKLKRICFVSSRTKAVFYKYSINRFILRKLVNKGNLFGISRNSW